jgi:hypothetical protein
MARPCFTPSDDQRRMVKAMAAMGIPQEQVGQLINCRSPKTLRKHFREELDVAASEANFNVAKVLYNLATSGKVPAATMFWLKCRAGWRESPIHEPLAIPPPPFIVAQDKGVQP